MSSDRVTVHVNMSRDAIGLMVMRRWYSITFINSVTLLRTSATLCSSGPHTRHVCVASKAVTI